MSCRDLGFTKPSTTADRIVVRALISAVAIAAAGSSAYGQPRMIVVSPTTVQQGVTARVQSPPCSGAVTVRVDQKLFPAKSEGGDFILPTDSLAIGTHEITTACGDVVSDAASLAIVPAKPVGLPTVVCARNLSPRDGVASALTSALDAAETKRIADAKAKADAARQSFPTPEEITLLLGRCDKDWVWTLRLEDRISLNVTGYSEWAAVEENKQKAVHLFVDGIELPHLDVKRVAIDPVTKVERLDAVLTFDDTAMAPESRQASQKALAQVLRTARAKAWDFGTGDMPVSLGPANGPQWPTTAAIRINPYPPGLAISAAGGVIGLLIVLIAVAWMTPLLRDKGGKTAPYSLAKMQMAVWFFVIFSAFLFITVTTGQSAALSTTALVLIGISGATGLVAAAIDSRKRSTDESERRSLEAEKAALTLELDGADGLRAKRQAAADGSAEAAQLDPLIQARVQRLEVVTKKLDDKPVSAPLVSRGWVTDILSDEYGLSFHRLQMAAWTVAMVAVFIVAVWRTFAMPDFDATMLGLLGISSGTYLGFKFPERETPSNPPAN